MGAIGLLAGGAARRGFRLEPEVFLPPLTFGEDEADAVILGLCLVAQRRDPDMEDEDADPLALAAEALTKIAAALPPEAEDGSAADDPPMAAPREGHETPHLAAVRRAIRREAKLRLRYTDKKGATTERTVWPIAFDVFEADRMLAAWCETRSDFRRFRLDRIDAAEPCDERMPRRRRILLAEWRAQQDMEW